ncbi:MAG: Ig-like domain-containing protein [Nanoarchaeota archaeon]|nr:Ig-like domain-containing protein [Nanoarchaeota archaeon]
MYFTKKSEVAVLLAVLLVLVGSSLLVVKGVGAGITGAAVIGTQDVGIQGTSNINGCQELNLSGETYRLLNSVTSTATCFTIMNHSITLDCSGWGINYDTAGFGWPHAINNSGGYDNITIMDCSITQTVGRGAAILFLNSSNSTIKYNNISGGGGDVIGIKLDNTSDTLVMFNNITLTGADSFGIFLNGTLTSNNLLVNNNITIVNGNTIKQLGNAFNSLIYNNSFGQIIWNMSNMSNKVNLSMSRNTIYLENNLVGFADFASSLANDSAFNLNKSARIEIRNLMYEQVPDLLKFGVRCDNSNDSAFRCNVTYDRVLGILSANVTSFSNYSTQENDPPNVTIVSPTDRSNFSSNFVDFNVTITDTFSNVSNVTFQFSNVSSPFNRTPANHSFTGWGIAALNTSIFAEGLQGFRVLANDTYNNTNNTQFINFTVDRSAPLITANQPTDGEAISGTAQSFSATVTDTYTDVQSVIFQISNGTGIAFNRTATEGILDLWDVLGGINTFTIFEGVNTVTVFANDSVGNLNTTFSISVTVDNTPPYVNITNPFNWTNFTDVIYNFNATIRNVSGTGQSLLDTVIFQFSNATGTSFNRTPTNVSGTWNAAVNLEGLIEGVSVMTVFANDSENNRNNSQTVTFIVDKTAPTVAFNSLNANNLFDNSNYSVRSGNITFNASVSDNLTLVDTVFFWLDNETGNDINITSVNNSGQWTISYNVSTLAEGRQGVRIMANNTVGKLERTIVRNFTVDFTSPNITRNFLNNPVNDSNFSIRSSNQTFNASVFDNLLLLDTVYFWFDNGTSQDFNITGRNISGQWIVNYNLSTLAEGRQGVRIIANDTVNNVNNSAVINFTIDFTGPNVNITNPANGTTISGTQAFSARITDSFTAVDTVIFQFTNSTNPFNRTASNSSGTWSVSVNTAAIDEGALTVTVFANDTVGNLNSTQILSLTIDNIADVGGGGGEAATEASISPTPSTPTPSAPAEAAPSPPSTSETASAAEVSNSFQTEQSSVGITSAGTTATTAYTSVQNYKLTITNNLNKRLVLSGALKEKETQLENEENAINRIKEELLLEGEVDEAALEEELDKLKLLESVEILQAHKKISHFFPDFLVGNAVAPPLTPSRKRINGNLLKDILLNAEELENMVVNPGETVEKEAKIRRGLSLDRKEPPKIIFISGGEQVLVKDIEEQEQLVTGTAVDIDQKTKKLDYYMIFAPRQNGGKETFTVEMNINTKNTKINPQLPLKIKLPFFFPGSSKNIYNEILGPYTVNMEKGALIAAQYDTDLPLEYEVVTKIFNKKGAVVAKNKVEVKS